MEDHHVSLPEELPPSPWSRDEFTARRFDRIIEQELARWNAQHVAYLPARPRLTLIQGGRS